MMKVHFLIVTWSSGTFLLWCHRLWARGRPSTLRQRVLWSLSDSLYQNNIFWPSVRPHIEADSDVFTISVDILMKYCLTQCRLYIVEPSFRRNDRETEYFVWDSGLMDSASLVTSVQQWGQETLSRELLLILRYLT